MTAHADAVHKMACPLNPTMALMDMKTSGAAGLCATNHSSQMPPDEQNAGPENGSLVVSCACQLTDLNKASMQ